MPYDSSGTYALPTDAADTLSDFADALNDPILKNGKTATTAEIPFAHGIAPANVRVGPAAAYLSMSGLTPRLQILGTGAEGGSMAIVRHTPGGGGAVIFLCNTNAAIDGARSAMTNNQGMGNIEFRGDDGYDLIAGAQINGAVDGAVSQGKVPTRLMFNVANPDSGSNEEAWRIDSFKNFGNNVDGSSNRLIHGGGKRVIALRNADVVPTSSPTGGGILYPYNGALYWRGSSGTVTCLGAA